jgi:hypothetical protein
MSLIVNEPVAVDSSAIAEVEYDTEASRLRVVFTSGAEYEYEDVPQDVYAGLLDADSVGRYFIDNIRDRYEF